MDISERKRIILKTVVSLYSDSGDPVGSKILNRFLSEISVSSATIRNEMAELTALGLLTQPHTSAGRTPTAMGMRYYLDNLLQEYAITQEEERKIREDIESLDSDPDKAAEMSAKILSDMFGLATVVMTPKNANPQIVHFRTIRVGKYNIAVIGVTNTGSVSSRVCRVSERYSAEHDAATIENLLNTHLVFKSYLDIGSNFYETVRRELGEDSERFVPIISAAIALLGQISDVRVYLDGVHNLIKYKDIEDEIGEVLEFLSDSDSLIPLMSRRENQITVYMGGEKLNYIDNFGLITGPYFARGLKGGIGIAGPIRMKYAYIIPRLKYFCKFLSKNLSG
ncbi:MAG: heat-inducible transcription repressor HrcA [Ruminococcaceae bacterium]|nr:heat-inducible transcription repressor HrcA [Oscillospiraceae bacterium]